MSLTAEDRVAGGRISKGRRYAPEGCLTIREIAAKLGMSPARVAQIEQQALAKLRKRITEGWR